MSPPRSEVGAFQSTVTVNYIRGVKNMGRKQFINRVGQRNYLEHIIGDERSYQNISNYIINNPASWKGKDLIRKEIN